MKPVSPLSVSKGETKNVNIRVEIKDNKMETAARIYDEYKHGRLCAHIQNGQIDLVITANRGKAGEGKGYKIPLYWGVPKMVLLGTALYCDAHPDCTPQQSSVAQLASIDGGSFTKAGDAAFSGGAIVLSNDRNAESGAWLKSGKMDVADSWTVDFVFEVDDPFWLNAGAGDGFVFMIQEAGNTVKGGPVVSTATATVGGYKGGGAKSVGVVFNTYGTNSVQVREQREHREQREQREHREHEWDQTGATE